MRYAFIRAHQDSFAVRNLCHMMRVHRSGYYVWIKQPKSSKKKDDELHSEAIKKILEKSGSGWF